MKNFLLLTFFAVSIVTSTVAKTTLAGDESIELRRTLANKYQLNEQQTIALRPALQLYTNSTDKQAAEKQFAESFAKVTGKVFVGF